MRGITTSVITSAGCRSRASASASSPSEATITRCPASVRRWRSCSAWTGLSSAIRSSVTAPLHRPQRADDLLRRQHERRRLRAGRPPPACRTRRCWRRPGRWSRRRRRAGGAGPRRRRGPSRSAARRRPPAPKLSATEPNRREIDGQNPSGPSARRELEPPVAPHARCAPPPADVHGPGADPLARLGELDAAARVDDCSQAAKPALKSAAMCWTTSTGQAKPLRQALEDRGEHRRTAGRRADGDHARRGRDLDRRRRRGAGLRRAAQRRTTLISDISLTASTSAWAESEAPLSSGPSGLRSRVSAPASSAPEALAQLGLGEPRAGHHDRRRRLLHDPAARRVAVQARHVHVHEDHVRPQLRRALDRLLARRTRCRPRTTCGSASRIWTRYSRVTAESSATSARITALRVHAEPLGSSRAGSSARSSTSRRTRWRRPRGRAAGPRGPRAR